MAYEHLGKATPDKTTGWAGDGTGLGELFNAAVDAINFTDDKVNDAAASQLSHEAAPDAHKELFENIKAFPEVDPGLAGKALALVPQENGGFAWQQILNSIRDAQAGTLRMWPSLTIPTLADGLPLGLSLDGAVVSLAAFPRLARVACPAGDNAWAPAWYRCNSGGTRSASGTYIKLDDWRGGFPQALDIGRGNTQSTVLVKTTSGSTSVAVINNLSDGGTLLTPKTSTGGIYPGLAVSGTGIPAGAKVASVSGTTVTLTVAATATTSSVEVKVTGRVLGSWQGDAMRNLVGGTSGVSGMHNGTTFSGVLYSPASVANHSQGTAPAGPLFGVDASRMAPIAPTIRPAGPAFNAIILV